VKGHGLCLVGVGLAVVAILGADFTAADPGRGGPRQDGRRSSGDPKVYTWVPPPEGVYDGSYGHGGVYFYGKDRMEVPGVVAVNRPPYVCDLDRQAFRDKQSFVAHLRRTHGDRLAERPDFIVHDGQVHFTGH
jgi:hypothetical protein